MKKQVLLFMMMLLPLVAMADAIEIDGVYYNLITKAKLAEVTSNPNKYAGNVFIPESLTYDGVNYSVKSIDGEAFRYCFGLTSITIPNSVTSIGNYAFMGCSGLTSITIPNSVTNIGVDAFADCHSLSSVHISDLEAWCNISFSTGFSNPLLTGHYLFLNGEEINNLIIPNKVTSIGDRIFAGCKSLTTITIPNCVTSIGNLAFYGCSSLTSVTIPDNVTSVGSYAFSGCSGLTFITLSNNITSICESLFEGCSNLTSVTIPHSVTNIDYHAFNGCTNLSSVIIGREIKIIDYDAFLNCIELADVYCYAENVPNTRNEAFRDSYIEYATLHVPAGSINAYNAVEPWRSFKSIVAIEDETPTTQKCEKPTISYENGQLKLSCATEGVEYVTDVTDEDIKKYYDATITLTATYNISVYATKAGYEDSEIATATLCWIDSDPRTEGTTTDVIQITARAVLTKTNNGFLTVEGLDGETMVSVYTIDGKQAGSATSHNGVANIATSVNPGSIAIVKVGEKSIKVIMK